MDTDCVLCDVGTEVLFVWLSFQNRENYEMQYPSTINETKEIYLD
jgi:hypothetical protein